MLWLKFIISEKNLRSVLFGFYEKINNFKEEVEEEDEQVRDDEKGHSFIVLEQRHFEEEDLNGHHDLDH